MNKANEKTKRKLEPRDLANLPSGRFEALVDLIDVWRDVPGREAAQSIRAVELIRVATSTRQLTKLRKEFLRIKQRNIATPQQIDAKLKAGGSTELIGILKQPQAVVLREEIAPYAFSQIVQTITCDAFCAPSGCLMTNLVEHLERSLSPPHECPKLLAFAVLCLDLSVGEENLTEIAADLRTWITEMCAGTNFNERAIRARLPQQQPGRIHRLAIEIAWPPPLQNEITGPKPLPEAYARWGIFRQRIPVHEEGGRRQTVTRLLAESETQTRTGAWPVDHVEISVEPLKMQDIEDEWEYKSEVSVDAPDDLLQPFPICIRMRTPSRGGTRACPTKQLTANDIVKIDDDKFHVRVQKTGVFVASSLECNQADALNRVKQALPHASIGLWSRKAFGTTGQEELYEALISVRAEEIPRVVHKLRSDSANEYIWRHVVLWFDPNLPQFRFSHENVEASQQSRTNAALM